MEALVALGLAGNVVQFVDFAGSLVGEARRIYRSAQGATQENQELELLARNLCRLAEAQDIRSLADKTQWNGRNPSQDDTMESRMLDELSDQCSGVANKLIALLDNLKASGKPRAGHSMYLAFKTAWKKDTIDNLQARLDRISNALNNHIQKTQQRRILRQVNLLHDDNLRLQATRESEIAELKSYFKTAFSDMELAVKEQDKTTLALIWRHLPTAAVRGFELSYEQYILHKLCYMTMDNRHFAITTEHANTFRWIFEISAQQQISGSPVNFVRWLESDNNLFWITGKPGSGKSTLMKFLAAHSEVVRLLNRSNWIGSSELITASFYFWSSAKDSLQKSQGGLLRSILYQILRKCPDLIPVAFPAKETPLNTEPSAMSSFNEVPYLLRAVENISGLESTHLKKFCLFIDGLDEYDGRPADVIQLIETLRNSPLIRLCVSSRPWNEFQHRFGSSEWKLSVHELTKKDIQLYVEDTLGGDPIFRDLRTSDNRYPELVRTIISSAEGVFLWVFLVVRSLLEGLTNADRISDLQGRLKEIPTDLEVYFESILFTVDSRYRQRMADTFLISMEATHTLPLLCHWFIDELEDDSEYAFKLEVANFQEPSLARMLEQSLKRLNARCKGLLEVRRPYEGKDPWEKRVFSWQVDFLHRTVSDFLAIDTMQKRLKSWSGGHDLVDGKICNAILATVKSAPSLRVTTTPTQLMETFFSHIERLRDHDPGSSLITALPRELSRTLSARDIYDYEQWVNNPDGSVAEYPFSASQSLIQNVDLGFLVACVPAGLVEYISEVVDEQPTLIEEIGPDLLAAALFPKASFRWGQEKSSIVSMLLQKGAALNQRARKPISSEIGLQPSVWQQYMTEIVYAGERLDLQHRLCSSSTFQSCKSLLEHGANPCAEIKCRLQGDVSAYSLIEDRGISSYFEVYRVLKLPFTEEQCCSLQEAFHPKHDEDAARIKRFLLDEPTHRPNITEKLDNRKEMLSARISAPWLKRPPRPDLTQENVPKVRHYHHNHRRGSGHGYLAASVDVPKRE